ncbi:MAG: DUF411 domain-containing protein [Pseudomonadota bacterium]
MLNRRNFIYLSSAALSATALPAHAATSMRVLTSPGCGCCHAWADLALARGFAVSVEELTDPEAQKTALGVPLDLASCHTVEADGYVFEGHVPFEALDAVLRDRPDFTGLAVPGMPMGSPGMGDDSAARYDVIAFGGAAGRGRVYYRAGTPQPFAG